MEIGVLSLKRKTLDASTEVFPVGPQSARDVVRQRFQSELVAVRRLLQKARSEGPPAKRSKKASPPSVTVIKRTKTPKKKMTQGERELVAADVAGLVAELPHHIVEFLEKQSCGIGAGAGAGEMEIDIHALQDEVVVELQQKLDMFVRERSNPSAQERANSEMMADEEEQDVDICGGVSPLAIAPAPLQLDEEVDEDVDICGDASPVAMLQKLGDDETISGSPSSSSSSHSDSDISSSDSDSDSSSDGSSDSESDEDVGVDSPALAERAASPPRTKLTAHAKDSLEKQRKEARSRAREKARQEVLETERTAMPDDETIHPTVLYSLGIVDQYNRTNLLRRLGLFLKADNYGIQERQHRHHRQIFQEDLEEGEIRV